ncbi:MAG: InlB B-repeat-containing protein, partial [Pseudobutyrivibrio sp.]|nr:InlB B-repeat-containing protein [Pseudobutyrivibrio sp.]
TVSFEYKTVPSNIYYSDRDNVVSAGSYVATITGNGEYKGSKTVKFEVKGGTPIKNAKLDKNFKSSIPYADRYNNPIVLYDAATGKLLKEDVDYIAYSATGPVAGATNKFTVYGIGKYSGTRAISYKVTGTKLAAKNVTITNKEIEYTSRDIDAADLGIIAKIPASGNESEKILKAGTDYIIAADSAGKKDFDELADRTNAGKKTFYIVGKGAYTGSVKCEFKITPFDLEKDFAKGDSRQVKFIYQNDKYPYTGAGMAPIQDPATPDGNVYVTPRELKNNFKFTYTSSQPKNKFGAGDTVKVTVKGQKNFKGTLKDVASYKVAALPLDYGHAYITVPDKNLGSWKAPSVTVVYMGDPDKGEKDKTLKAGTDYDVTFIYDKTTHITVGSGKKSQNLTRYAGELVQKGDNITEATELRAVVTGKKNYDNYGEDFDKSFAVVAATKDIKNVKVAKIADKQFNDCDVTLEASELIVTMAVKGQKDPDTLVLGRDYEIYTYAKNDKVGTATVTLHGINDYAGYKNVNFKITAKDMNYGVVCDYILDDGQIADGVVVTGTTTVKSQKDKSTFVLPNSKYTVKKTVKEGNKTVTTSYVLEGWYDDQGNPIGGAGATWSATIGGKAIEKGQVATIYAKFIEKKTAPLKITFKAGTAGTTDLLTLDAKKYKDKTQKAINQASGAKLSANTYVVPGYKFKKWKSSTNDLYDDNEYVYNNNSEGKDLVLTAQWDKITYNMVFMLGGGQFKEGSDLSELKTYDVETATYTLPKAENVLREGYTFEGWKLGKKIVEEIPKGTTGDLLLVAQWKPAKDAYTLTFDANGKTLKDNTPNLADLSQKITLGTANKLPSEKLQAEAVEFEFLGWSTNKDDKNALYKPGASVKFEGNTTLYAIWKEKSYSITYDAKGGTLTSTSYAKAFTKAGANSAILAVPTRDGYTFNGWTAVDSKNKAIEPALLEGTVGSQKIKAGTAQAIKLVADWKKNTGKVTIKCYGNGNTIDEEHDASETTQVFEVDSTSRKLDPNVFIKTGYNFIGWATSEVNATAKEVAFVDEQVYTVIPAVDTIVELWAVWAPIEYSIVYDLKGGEFAESATYPTSYSYGTGATIPNQLDNGTNTKATFGGWYLLEKNSEGKWVETETLATITSETTGEVRVYAKWNPWTLTVSFNANGGTLVTDATAPVALTFKSDDATTKQALPGLTYQITDQHKVQSGWNTLQNPTEQEPGESYALGEEINLQPSADGDEITLYAQYATAKKVTITFADGKADNEEVTGEMEAQEIYAGESKALTSIGYEITGKRFVRWTASDGKKYADGATYSVPADLADNTEVTLTA